MKFSYKRLLFVLLSLLILYLVIFLSQKYSSEEITSFISKAGILAPLLYLFIQILGQIFAPLSTSALFVAGFVMFGRIAILYAIITWLISSIINFYIARVYGKKVLKIFVGEEGIERIEKLANRIDDKTFFFLRISTFYISDFISYAFGLTNISFKKYYLATIVSIIPWIVLMTLVIESGDTILNTTIKVLASMIPFVIISYIYLKRKK